MGPSFLQALQTTLGGDRGLVYMYSGRVISGFGIGGISTVAPTFVSECAPNEVQGRITGFFQIMVATGVMLSYWINRELSLPRHFLRLSDPVVAQWGRLCISATQRMCGGFC